MTEGAVSCEGGRMTVWSQFAADPDFLEIEGS